MATIAVYNTLIKLRFPEPVNDGNGYCLYQLCRHLKNRQWWRGILLQQKDNQQQDRELVASCLSGSEEAWTHLYRSLYKTIHFITHWHKWDFSLEQSKEITQDIFATLITSLKTFKFDCSLETFAANIAQNKCISELRKITALKRKTDKQSISMYEADADGVGRVILKDTKPTVEKDLQREETEHKLKEALSALGEKCRTILCLRYYEDCSYEAIAHRLSLSIGTVASRIKRCLIELRTLYEKCGGA
jgi:RNA polymerase sigma-70 factor, ECF subfamily